MKGAGEGGNRVFGSLAVRFTMCQYYLTVGGNLGNFKVSLMVSKEVPIHKYLSGPQNYNPVKQARI